MLGILVAKMSMALFPITWCYIERLVGLQGPRTALNGLGRWHLGEESGNGA